MCDEHEGIEIFSAKCSAAGVTKSKMEGSKQTSLTKVFLVNGYFYPYGDLVKIENMRYKAVHSCVTGQLGHVHVNTQISFIIYHVIIVACKIVFRNFCSTWCTWFWLI